MESRIQIVKTLHHFVLQSVKPILFWYSTHYFSIIKPESIFSSPNIPLIENVAKGTCERLSKARTFIMMLFPFSASFQSNIFIIVTNNKIHSWRLCFRFANTRERVFVPIRWQPDSTTATTTTTKTRELEKIYRELIFILLYVVLSALVSHIFASKPVSILIWNENNVILLLLLESCTFESHSSTYNGTKTDFCNGFFSGLSFYCSQCYLILFFSDVVRVFFPYTHTHYSFFGQFSGSAN